jgi:hypothetical protein
LSCQRRKYQQNKIWDERNIAWIVYFSNISDFVGQLKGASSHEINQKLSQRDKILQWQSGYGVVSFGTGDLDWVIDYVRRQKEHHAQGKIHDRLERFLSQRDCIW